MSMSQHGPPSSPGPPVPGATPGDRNFPGELNRPGPPDVPISVPNAGTAPRPGRVADEAFVRALYAEHGGALPRYAPHLTGGGRQRSEEPFDATSRGRGVPPPAPRGPPRPTHRRLRR